jgi:hypothetical protein
MRCICGQVQTRFWSNREGNVVYETSVPWAASTATANAQATGSCLRSRSTANTDER